MENFRVTALKLTGEKSSSSQVVLSDSLPSSL